MRLILPALGLSSSCTHELNEKLKVNTEYKIQSTKYKVQSTKYKVNTKYMVDTKYKIESTEYEVRM